MLSCFILYKKNETFWCTYVKKKLLKTLAVYLILLTPSFTWQPHRWCNGKCARLECRGSGVQTQNYVAFFICIVIFCTVLSMKSVFYMGIVKMMQVLLMQISYLKKIDFIYTVQLPSFCHLQTFD